MVSKPSLPSTPQDRLRHAQSSRHAPRAVRRALCCRFSHYVNCDLHYKTGYGTRSVPATCQIAGSGAVIVSLS